MKTKIFIPLLLLSVALLKGYSPIVNKTTYTNTILYSSSLKLLNFDAVKNGDKVEIFWGIISETNHSFFTLERSRNGIDFEKVSKIDAANKGNDEISYIETDYTPLQGISYYRLRMTFSNNRNIYSHAVIVNNSSYKNNITIFPNTSNRELNISLKKSENSKTLVVLRDLKGNEYYSKVLVIVENSQIVGIDPEKKLTPGTYVVTASSNNLLYSQKLIVR